VKQLGFFLALSLLLHFLLSTSTLYFAERLHKNKNSAPLEFEILENKSEDFQNKIQETRQLIKQLKNTVQKIKDEQIKARFESEENQRFEKETRTAQLGISQNSSNKKMIPLPQNKINLSELRNENKTPPKNEYGEEPEFTKALRTGADRVNLAQESAISVNLPSDISLSNATNLNTDANTYYSFYSRVEELFYVRWVERNRYYWNRINFEFKKNTLAGKTWSTILEVRLKSNGEFHAAEILKSSGYQPFDDAAVFAFRDARLFPNPPKAKIEPDGFVRLRYRFNVVVGTF
jgi:TonB family protein